MAFRIPFEPCYYNNSLNGTDIWNGNGEKKGFTVKYASREMWHAVIYFGDDRKPEVLDGTYDSDDKAMEAILMYYAVEA